MGRVLFQKYEILEQLGKGGAGRVFLAKDKNLNRLVAVKERKLSSAVGFAGLARKLTIFLIVIVAGSLDALTGQQNVCRAAAVALYFVNEAVSLLENAAKLGLPVPEKIVDVLTQLKGEK